MHSALALLLVCAAAATASPWMSLSDIPSSLSKNTKNQQLVNSTNTNVTETPHVEPESGNPEMSTLLEKMNQEYNTDAPKRHSELMEKLDEILSKLKKEDDAGPVAEKLTAQETPDAENQTETTSESAPAQEGGNPAEEQKEEKKENKSQA